MTSARFAFIHITMFVGGLFALALSSRHAHADEPLAPLPAPSAPPTVPETAPAPTAAGTDAPTKGADATTAPDAKRIFTRLEGGYTLRRLFDIDIKGVEGAAYIGADPKPNMGVFGGLSYSYNTTPYGLAVHVPRVLGGVEAILAERVRLGGTLGFGAIVINRATNAPALWKLGLAMAIHATVDLVRAEDLSVFLGAHGGFDAYPHLEKEWDVRAVLLSGGLRLGVRF